MTYPSNNLFDLLYDFAFSKQQEKTLLFTGKTESISRPLHFITFFTLEKQDFFIKKPPTPF